MKSRANGKQFVICVKNGGYEASLERRKIYRVLPDKKASQKNLLRIIDESRQSYLYPQHYFVPIKLTQTILKAGAFSA